MRPRLSQITEALAANLWLVPLLAFVLAVVLSRTLETFDRTFDITAKAWFVYGGSPSGARQLLSTIAGSMITFIGMVFSSTILVLQLASQQFSPRIMRSFFRDRIIQVSLGTFIATFAYAILVLREIREEPGHEFVPGLSTYAAITLVWLSLGMFVIYINHIGHRIRAARIVEIAAEDTITSLERLGSKRPEAALAVIPTSAHACVEATRHGVVAEIDARALLKIAIGHDVLIEVVPQCGDFVCVGAPIARVWNADDLLVRTRAQIVAAVSVERERTIREDPLFGLRQLVDVAEKALSPGINDPTTAVTVLDQLHEVLRRVAETHPRTDVHCDEMGVQRVFVPRPSWQQYVDSALEEILLYGRKSIHVMRRMRTLVIDLDDVVALEARPALRSLSRSHRTLHRRVDRNTGRPCFGASATGRHAPKHVGHTEARLP